MRQTSLFVRIPIGTLFILLVAGASSGTASLASSPQAAGESTKTLTATVRTADTEADTVKVVTGVGHALRIVKLQLSTECEIKVAGAQGQLADLKPGDVVRIRYRKTDDANVAEAIETVQPEGSGGER